MKTFAIILFLIFTHSLVAQQITITQNNNTTNITAGGLVCFDIDNVEEGELLEAMYFDNHFARSFDLQNDHDIAGEFVISSVGIAQRRGQNMSIDINIYTSNTINLDDPDLDLNLVATETLPVFDLNNDELLFVNIDAVIPAGEILVVEIFAPNSGTATNKGFSMGINNAGHTQPSYIKAPECDVVDFMNAINLDAGDEAYIMTVTGEETLSTNQNEISKIEVYPNPVTSVLNIDLPSSVVLKEAQLINMNAQVQNVKYVDGFMDVSNLASGQYMLKLSTNSGTFIHKVIKD